MGGFSHPKKWKNPPGLEKSTQKVEKNLLILTVIDKKLTIITKFPPYRGIFWNNWHNWQSVGIETQISAFFLSIDWFFNRHQASRTKMSQNAQKQWQLRVNQASRTVIHGGPESPIHPKVFKMLKPQSIRT